MPSYYNNIIQRAGNSPPNAAKDGHKPVECRVGETSERTVNAYMSYAKLRGKIREKFATQEDFAEAMGMDRSTLSLKLNSKSEWSRIEIEKACYLLGIQIEEVYAYFFTEKVGNSQQ